MFNKSVIVGAGNPFSMRYYGKLLQSCSGTPDSFRQTIWKIGISWARRYWTGSWLMMLMFNDDQEQT